MCLATCVTCVNNSSCTLCKDAFLTENGNCICKYSNYYYNSSSCANITDI